MSFIIVGVYWVAHQHMLHFIKQVDRKLLWLNLLLLSCVVFIPFPTSLLGTGYSNPLVVRLYGTTLIATNAAGLFFWLYATSIGQLAVPHSTPLFARWVAKLHSSPIVLYALAIAMAGWKTPVSLLQVRGSPFRKILLRPGCLS